MEAGRRFAKMLVSIGRWKCIGALFVVATLFLANTPAQGEHGSDTLPSPVHLTSDQDQQRLMALLRIPELRRGPDGDPKSPNAANVDESKVPSYSLPDPLVLKNGKTVTTPEMWWKQRRPESSKTSIAKFMDACRRKPPQPDGSC
jgi:hypothetical protein